MVRSKISLRIAFSKTSIASIMEKDSMQKINELFKPNNSFHIIIESYHIDDDKSESSLFLDRKNMTVEKPKTVFVEVSNNDDLEMITIFWTKILLNSNQ